MQALPVLERAAEMAEPLEARRKYTIPEYEAIRGQDHDVDRRPVETMPDQNGTVAFLGVDNERRVYTA